MKRMKKMFKWLIDSLIGTRSKRFQFTVLYLIIFLAITFFVGWNTYLVAAFSIFSGIIGYWINVETKRRGDD